MTKKSYLVQAFTETPWAILPNKFAVLQGIVARHEAGEKLSAEEIQARINGNTPPQQQRVKRVAVLPLFGVIVPRADFFTEISGATSAETLGNTFTKLVNDPEVDAIILNVDSPGGQTGGVEELSKKIFDARGKKPILAVANHLMASAAYWIASAADEIVITPSGEVGSIGVFTVHEDFSKALEEEGIKTSLISAGKYKTEGNPYQPLDEEARAFIQSRVDEAYETFIQAVARNRGVNADEVRNGYGEGRVLSARQAVNLKMADRIGTLEEVIDQLVNQNVSTASSKNAVSTLQENDSANKQVLEAESNPSLFLSQAREQVKNFVSTRYEGDLFMNLRELLKERDALVQRGQALVDVADKENRDFTDEERKEFAEIFGGDLEGNAVTGKVPELDAKIQQIQSEREKLKAALEANFTGATQAEKPSANTAKSMKRADFDKLDANAQSAFIRSGGKLEE
jgi:signal peptide peptidase SppA